MFFAGNTPKRGFSTRKCKESARMASLNTSPTAVRTFVPGACPALASGAPRTTERDSWARRTDLGAAVLGLAMLGLGVVGALPTAVQAKALASASINITEFYWRKTTGEIVTVSDNLADNPDVLFVGSGGELADVSVQLTRNDSTLASASTNGSRSIQSGMANNLVWFPGSPPICVDNPAACSAAPTGFAPVGTNFPDSEYVSGDMAYSGFYADVDGLTSTGATLGMRSDASIATQPATANPESALPFGALTLSSSVLVRAMRTFSSYFEVHFQAQALGRVDDVPGTASAETIFLVGIQPFLNPSLAPLSWNPAELNQSVKVERGDDEDKETGPVRPIFSYGTNPVDAYELLAGERYTLGLDVAVTARAELRPAEVPLPASFWLLLAGMGSILVVRAKAIAAAHRRGRVGGPIH
jgi:hypothetical protein